MLVCLSGAVERRPHVSCGWLGYHACEVNVAVAFGKRCRGDGRVRRSAGGGKVMDRWIWARMDGDRLREYAMPMGRQLE